jgi:hypothetical protein
VRVIRYCAAATIAGLLSTNVSVAEEHHHDGGAVIDQNTPGNSSDSKSSTGPNADVTRKDAGTNDKSGSNTIPPPSPDARDGSKSFETTTTNSGPPTKDGGHHPPMTEGKDIDTSNTTVRPSSFGKEGKDLVKDRRDFRDFKGHKEAPFKDGVLKTYAVPKGKFAGHDRKPGDVGPHGPVRNALGVAVVNSTPGKDTPNGPSLTGPDNKIVNSPVKNSIGLPVTDAGHLGLANKDAKFEGPTSPHWTTNGAGISGTGMDKGVTHTAAIGGVKLNLQGISGNNVHLKH